VYLGAKRRYINTLPFLSFPYKSAAHIDSPDGGIGKTCLGGGMHCPSASSLFLSRFFTFLTSLLLFECFYKALSLKIIISVYSNNKREERLIIGGFIAVFTFR